MCGVDFQNKTDGFHCCTVTGLAAGGKFVTGPCVGSKCSARSRCSETGLHAGLSVSLARGAGLGLGMLNVLSRAEAPKTGNRKNTGL